MRYLLLAVALPLLAEVTPAQREAYFKAASKSAMLKQQLAEAQLAIITGKPASVEADAELQKAITAMAEACKDTKLIVNEKGDPACAPAPAPVKKDK